MGVQTSKHQYTPKKWSDILVTLGSRTQNIKISVIGEALTGKTKFINKTNAILRGLKDRIRLREVHDLTTESLNEDDGIIIIGSVKNLGGIDEIYEKLTSNHRSQACILIFITHTDQASRDEMISLETLTRQHIHADRIFYAPVCDPFSADAINDSDFTILCSIQTISECR